MLLHLMILLRMTFSCHIVSGLKRGRAVWIQGLVVPKAWRIFNNIFVLKPDGSFRPSIDNRRLNAVVVLLKYPVPALFDLQTVGKSNSVFSHIDLLQGFW